MRIFLRFCIYFKLFSIILCLDQILKLKDQGYETADVNFEIKHLYKRSIYSEKQYDVKIRAFDQDYHLKLTKPAHTVFKRDFKFLISDSNETGHQILRPAYHNKSANDGEIFTDPGSNAAVLLHHSPDDEITIHGLIDDMAITHVYEDHNHTDKRKIHLARKSKPKFLTMSQQKAETFDDNTEDNVYRKINESEVIQDLLENFTGNLDEVLRDVEVETLIFLDMKKYRAFSNNDEVIKYLRVFMHAVNNRYATFTQPSITFRISSLIVSNSRGGQPFMEQSKNPKGQYDISKVLNNFAIHFKNNMDSYVNHDLAHLISGEDLIEYDEDENIKSSASGRAFKNGVCSIGYNKSYKTGISEDLGEFYEGVFTVVHELAHNLGANHDGNNEAVNCSWDDGYLMSYKGWGNRNKFYFSPCSIRNMNNLIQSKSCLKHIDGETPWDSEEKQPGDLLSMEQQCQKLTGKSHAYVDKTKSPDELCKKLCCEWVFKKVEEVGLIIYTRYTYNRICANPALDNTICDEDSGKRCKNGECV